MKMNLNNYSDVDVMSSTEEKKLRLSKDSDSIIFKIFSSSIYSDPIGSIVREITSNCFDSHIEAGVDTPIIIRKHEDKQTNTQYISFIDFGMGMSPERIDEVFSVYFESTKRSTNEQIGGFGLGSKSVLAYKRSTGHGENEYDNSYQIITNYNGINYVYLIYDGKESPKITLQFEVPTTERNGTEVRVPVLEGDVEKFERAMKKQLYYFENVVFEGFEYEKSSGEIVSNIENNYQIIRGKNFLFRGDTYSNAMHICLGRVAYPIDYSTLNLDSSEYRLPVAVRLEVGDLNVTVSREAIDYSEKTIKMLKKKLEAVKAEIIGMIDKQYRGIQTLEQYFTVKNDFGKLKFPNGVLLYVGNLIKQKDIDFSNFKYSFMKMPTDKQLFRFFFTGKMYGKKPSRSRWGDNDTSFKGGYEDITGRRDLLYFENEFKRKVIKQAYLREEHETYYIIGKNKVDIIWNISGIAELFNVHIDKVIDDNGKPVAFVQSLIEMQDEYWEIIKANVKDYDTVEVPEDFIASRKRGAGITPELRKMSICVDFIGGYKHRINLSTLFDYKMPIFWGTTNDKRALEKAKEMYETLWGHGVVISIDYQGNISTSRYGDNKSKASMMFIQLAKNNTKHMQHCQKAFHVSKFKAMYMHRKEAMVRKYFETNELVEKYDALDDFYSNKDGLLSVISPKWNNVMSEIHEFVESIPEQSKNSSLYYLKKELTTIYKLNNIKPSGVQKIILKKIDKIDKLSKKNESILNYINIPYNCNKENVEPELIDILKKIMAF